MRSAITPPNKGSELTAHSVGFLGSSLRLFLWAAAQARRWVARIQQQGALI